MPYGDEALRVIVAGPPYVDVDFIYMRQGEVIQLVAYLVPPLSTRDKGTTWFTEEVAVIAEKRYSGLRV
jgi:hypothetical protein